MDSTAVKPVRWTVSEYFRMADAGLFDRFGRVELLDGEVVEERPQTGAHMAAVTRTARLLFEAFDPSTSWVVIRGTLARSRYTAPDPDFHVFGFATGTLLKSRPLPLIVIEVADGTYEIDAGLKLREYARRGIEDYWILNVPEGRVEVYRRPERSPGRRSAWRYASETLFGRGEVVRMLKRPGVALPVDAMFS